jgi:hypothetical protein
MKHDVLTSVKLSLYFLFGVVVALLLRVFTPIKKSVDLTDAQLGVAIAVALGVVVLTTILWTFAMRKWNVPLESVYGLISALVITQEFFRITGDENKVVAVVFYLLLAFAAVYTFACMKYSWKSAKEMYPFANVLMLLTIVIVMVQTAIIIGFAASLFALGAFALYDYIAVKKGLMVDLAKGFLKQRIVPGIVVPKREGRKLAIIGGGDVAFLVLVATAAYTISLAAMVVMAACMFAGLMVLLFVFSEKGKFYPALPPIFIGALVGLVLTWLL